ncbi:hypothetical protein M2G91_20660 [Vibrio vulnificus]|nr:hypothetical protein [Vibrio vulnificus]
MSFGVKVVCGKLV